MKKIITILIAIFLIAITTVVNAQKIRNGGNIKKIMDMTKNAPPDTNNVKIIQWGSWNTNTADTIRYWATWSDGEFILHKSFKQETVDLILCGNRKYSVRKEKQNPCISVLQEILDLNMENWQAVISEDLSALMVKK